MSDIEAIESESETIVPKKRFKCGDIITLFKKTRWIKNGYIEDRVNEEAVYKFTQYSVLFVILFSVYNFGWALLLGFITSVMFAEDILIFVGDEWKQTALGCILGVAAFIQFILGPIIGKISDDSKLLTIKIGSKSIEIGKRKPYIYIGMAFYLLSVFARIFFRWELPLELTAVKMIGFAIYCIFGIIGNAFSCVALTTYTAMFPDLFHPSQYDFVSAVLGFSQLLGGAFSVGVLGFLWSHVNYYILVSIVVVLGFLSVLPVVLFKEEFASENFKKRREIERAKLDGTESIGCCEKTVKFIKEFIKPFRSWNYFWVFTARFIFMFSIASLQSFLLYFLKDCVKVYEIIVWTDIITHEDEAQAVVASIIFFFGLLSSFGGPWLSKKIQRKFVVCLSGIIMVGCLLAFIVSRNFSAIMLFSVPFGIGMGSFYAVDMALVNEVLPEKSETAKDLAIFSIASVVPFALAGPIMGFLITFGNNLYTWGAIPIENFGYFLLFGFSIFVQILGSIFVTFVRKGKGQSKKDFKKFVDEIEDNIFDEDSIEKMLNERNAEDESENYDVKMTPENENEEEGENMKEKVENLNKVETNNENIKTESLNMNEVEMNIKVNVKEM